jgi:tRNA A-37 threonylcarbamoyl transferase component Bud32
MSLQAIRSKLVKDLRGVIPEIRKDNYNFKLYELKSRKNTVLNLVFDRTLQDFPQEFVVKIFRTKNIVSENNILTRLKNQNFHVPKIFSLKKPYLILEKIEGINLCDFINDNLKDTEELDDLDSDLKTQITSSIEILAKWLAQLHKKNLVRKRRSEEILVLNKGDTRLRDFILDPSREILFGVDFEDAFEGSHMDDLAWICCSLLDTSPGLFDMDEPKHKIDLINIFLRKYYQTNSSFQFDFNYFTEKIIGHLNIVIERRNLPYGPIRSASFIENISKEI